MVISEDRYWQRKPLKDDWPGRLTISQWCQENRQTELGKAPGFQMYEFMVKAHYWLLTSSQWCQENRQPELEKVPWHTKLIFGESSPLIDIGRGLLTNSQWCQEPRQPTRVVKSSLKDKTDIWWKLAIDIGRGLLTISQWCQENRQPTRVGKSLRLL